MARDPEVNVKVKADSRELTKLRREAGQSFDVRPVREYSRSIGDLDRRLGGLLRTMQSINRESRVIRDMRDDFRELTRETTQAERSLERVRGALRRSDRDQDRREEKRRRSQQRRQGFVGGLAQGLGVAEYVPTGAEQAPRLGGAMLGRGIRRAGRAVSAPFMMPGVGGMAQGFGGIPIVGGFIGGAIQSAAGMYQQAVGFHRISRQMLAYQGSDAGRIVYGRRRGADAAYRQALEEVEAAKVQRRVAYNQRGPQAIAARQAERAVQQAEARRRGVTQQDHMRMENLTQRLQAGRGGGIGAMGRQVVRTQRAVGTRAERAARRNVEAATQKDKQAADERLKDARDAARRAKAFTGRTTRRLTGLPGAGAGAGFGLGPQEMMQLFGQFMGARGGTYEGVERSQFYEAMAAQTRFGVSGQQAGQFARMGIAGGGGRGMGQGLAGVLQAAVAQGMRGSQVTEYLQTLVQLGQQAERTGVKINVTEFTRSAATLTASGLQGVQAQRVAGGMNQAAMTLSQKGVQSPIDVMIARAAGFDPAQGPEGYARAMNKMAGGMTTDMMNKLLANLTQGAGAGGFGPEMQALMLRRAMGRMGVQIGPGQATRLLDSYRGAEGGLSYAQWNREAKLQDMISQGEAPEAGAWLRGGAKRAVRYGAGLTVGAAGLQAYQVGVGARAAKWVLPLERASAQAASAISRLGVLRDFAKVVERATKALDKIVGAPGDLGFLDALKELVNAIRGGGGKPPKTG